MPLPKLLYLCINDGSDTRINKEIRTLASQFEIIYVGIGRDESQAFVKPFCTKFHLVKGHHKSIGTLVRYFFTFVNLYFTHRFRSIHVINEQLLLIFLPFLVWSRRRVVADIFDSIFLRSGNPVVRSLQSLLYRLPKTIIVTDDNRKTLVPAEFQKKTVVVENYPYAFHNLQPKAAAADELLILYSGSLGTTRGTMLLTELLKHSPKVKVWMIGWVYDEPTRLLSQHPQVIFWGVKTQQETMRLASECDYILSVYEPINDNNLNASPNKIYDAIQAQTPVIINAEVKVARFVAENRLGCVLANYYITDVETLAHQLISLKKGFLFAADFRRRYTWEAIEHKLIAAHE
ncbi:hypothetical protein [Runella slithyformis]|uniref:Glycosyltransferase n=1 Tax=Runella slithyformis (strain ATCC 29530 / DSM 19594 / LMG 11500 / NCIMB 11436 / LSU 4) TaxID=761193 RepID=A0A7U3ZJV6_RUNSL|nr:hypothetical protein [Runella slithyformis]AEI48570.1 hypothetical protein Runsl_2157 [Runella slithyformis DSM 19594]